MHRNELGGVPLILDPELLAGRGLDEAPAQTDREVGNPRRILVAPDGNPKNTVLFIGDVIVAVYESPPGKFELVDTLYDEYVHVLAGKLILTDGQGHVCEAETGDHILVPKGFCGTWEMVGDVYRELVVAERKTLIEDMKAA